MLTNVAFTTAATLKHNFPNHPENNERVPAIVEALRSAKLLERMTEITNPAAAKLEQVTEVHQADYVQELIERLDSNPTYLDSAPTYFTHASLQCALHAAGASIALVDTVLDKNAQSGFALIRPPGHHAVPGAAMGFCLLANIAIAARHAQKRGVERILIIDFDVHHGNGTQEIFYDDCSVLFVSIHQEGLYPGGGQAYQTGINTGQGFTLNIPIPAYAGGSAVQQILSDLIFPSVRHFCPELILVSAGFDAHWRDNLSNLQYSGRDYHVISTALQELASEFCSGQIVFFLEGGYDLPALSESAVNVFRALLGEPSIDTLGPPLHPEPDIRNQLTHIRSLHDF